VIRVEFCCVVRLRYPRAGRERSGPNGSRVRTSAGMKKKSASNAKTIVAASSTP